jgi:hypothetical protein
MLSIDVGQGLIAIIDPEDLPRVDAFTWRIREDGYIQRTWIENGRTHHELLHRFIMEALEHELVDHENGDRWDCRKENLRVATLSQNAANRPTTSLERVWKGIYPHGNRWKARIKREGQNVYLGSFQTPQEAAYAYDAAARRLFGDFARLNFPATGS